MNFKGKSVGCFTTTLLTQVVETEPMAHEIMLVGLSCALAVAASRRASTALIMGYCLLIGAKSTYTTAAVISTLVTVTKLKSCKN